MIRIFVGYDRKETAAYHTLCHSILSRASEPVHIVPLNRANLARSFWRPRGEYDSTDFSNSRWIVPHLSDYEGWSIFMDCDMLCLGDIAELWAQRDPRYAVLVKKHVHDPVEDVKFLGQRQTRYQRKNWSSLMLFNNERCRMLTKHLVNTMASGLWFHQFEWLPEDEIGEIHGAWNLLVGHDDPVPDPKLVHFTSGGPWHGYIDVDYADRWIEEYADMITGDNPIAWRESGLG